MVAEELERRRRQERREVIVSRLISILPILAVLGMWELISRVGPEYIGTFLPSPSQIAAVSVGSLLGGDISFHVADTLKRAYVAYFIAAGMSIPFGLLLGWFRFAYRVFEPILEVLRPIPSITLIMPAILFLGIGDRSQIFVITWSCFFIVVVNAIYGVLGVDEVMALSFRSMGARGRDLFRKLVVPSSLPFIFAGLRQATAIALIVAIAVEMIIGNSGIGYYIFFTGRSFRYEEMYGTIIITGLVGYAIARIFLLIEGRYLRWAKEKMEG